jgi:hypothetical protein
MSMDPQESGSGLAEFLLGRLDGTRVEDVYIDEDEDGNYLGLVFSDDEREYHLTVDKSGEVQLAEGPLEGDSLEEVKTFRLDLLTAPFSDDSTDE